MALWQFGRSMIGSNSSEFYVLRRPRCFFPSTISTLGSPVGEDLDQQVGNLLYRKGLGGGSANLFDAERR
jgi:hypothetical protein